MWRIESRLDPARWVEHDGKNWVADEATTEELLVMGDGPQPMTPTGPIYVPTSKGDPYALYLAALAVVPAPQVTGTPPPRPPLPEIPAAPPESGIVY